MQTVQITQDEAKKLLIQCGTNPLQAEKEAAKLASIAIDGVRYQIRSVGTSTPATPTTATASTPASPAAAEPPRYRYVSPIDMLPTADERLAGTVRGSALPLAAAPPNEKRAAPNQDSPEGQALAAAVRNATTEDY